VSALAPFAPEIRAWFNERFDAPTDVQTKAWPVIASGEHTLLTAPTGSGKTLTAFLWALDRLATGAWDPSELCVLYVSPLKALNRDIAINLLDPLEGLARPEITVGVRSGDTDTAERRRQLKKPPSILVTTPESLHLLLSSHGGRRILPSIRTVILDEIHAVADNKRGTLLMSAVERLTELTGEFQRVALSATVNPMARMAAFVGGPERSVRTVESTAEKRIDLTVHSVPQEDAPLWPRIAAEIRDVALKNRSTLVFVNSRARAEHLTRLVNESSDEPIAYAHHGSLAHATRQLVEERLKCGELRAIIATSSLELGIDIGALDEVLLIQSPPSMHSAVQRVGRAGHHVGATSVGRLYATFGRDAVDAAVLAPLVRERAVESLRIPRAPLDVLAQVLVAMCGVEERTPDSLFRLLTRSDPFHDLTRASFDRVVAMLCGRYADSRVRELRPRLHQHPESGLLQAAKGALSLVWGSGGVIPDRGYYTVRIQGHPGKLGELDEEFVWEARRGDLFAFGAQTWEVVRVRRDDVEVVPSNREGAKPPFWRAEAISRDFEFCERIGTFLEEADSRIDDDHYAEVLERERHLTAEASTQLVRSMRAQRESTGCSLPHRRHIVVEHPRTTAGGGTGKQVILHAPWGARVLRPLEIALAAAWEAENGERAETFSNNDCILVTLTSGLAATDIFRLVNSGNVESLLRGQLERSAFFGGRFRECAQRALLLPRGGFGKRTPLWLNRLRSARLLQNVRRYDDFPILAETWRTCLEDEFDLAALHRVLDEVAGGSINVSEVETATPSPFAGSIGWQSVNTYMYEDDRGVAEGATRLSDRVIAEALRDSTLRPRIDPSVIDDLDAKLRRTAPGYAPESDEEWRVHVEERLLVRAWDGSLPDGLQHVEWGGGWVVSERQRARLERARDGDSAALVSVLEEQLRYRGPVTVATLADEWDVNAERIAEALDTLVERGGLIADLLSRDAEILEFCDAENLERLLRMSRDRPRQQWTPRPLRELAPFLAARQGIGHPGDLPSALESLFGFEAPVTLWESALLPARVDDYRPEALDDLMRDSDLVWFGTGKERVSFAFREDLPLFLAPRADAPTPFPEAGGRYDFFELQERAQATDTSAFATRIWELAFEGAITNDSFAALRQGVANRFKPASVRKTRRGFQRWQSSRPLLGNWSALRVPAAENDLEELERDKERARILLGRYGLLCRALLKNESTMLGWGRLQRALRIMELAGEVVAGIFFEGLDGLQFMARGAWKDSVAEGIWWTHSMDPASLCGTGLDASLPPRSPSTLVVRDGADLLLVLRRNGAELHWHGEPRSEALAVLDALGRSSRKRIQIETIDGQTAARHTSAALFLERGFFDDRGQLIKDAPA